MGITHFRVLTVANARAAALRLWLGLAAFTLAALLALPAAAQTAQDKIARDLRAAISAGTTPRLNWVKDVNGVRYVKALLISNNSNDPDLSDLRADVLARGGSVYFRYVSVTALSVMLPAQQVAAIAARADVQSVSPNRMTARSASALEATTGAWNSAVRTYWTRSTYTGPDGSGVGIAILDSGLMWSHNSLLDANGYTRVKRAVDFQKAGDATLMGVKDWTPGIDASASLYPGSATISNYEDRIANDYRWEPDKFGHGTHVAAVAAGRGFYQSTDSTGIAPNANLYDVKVLDANGFGQLSDVLAGIDWVIYHAREYNIRVLNLSLAADSTETYLTDPLARAARAAVAAGIVVVAAAGNYGTSNIGAETFGTVASPGHDPNVITVGSVNMRGTTARGDDTINFFSSRGPTRGSYVDANGVRRVDNLIKPDLVAPGNRVLAAMATNYKGDRWNWLATNYPTQLPLRSNYTYEDVGRTLMFLSGTSIAAPNVAGAAALLLQVNPGLTPPLVKAILQYTAQPLPNAGLVQQGAGLLNVEGAVRLARVLRTDIASAVENGTINAGDPLLAAGQVMPMPVSSFNGETFGWSRVVFAGGSHLLSGTALFTQYQPIWDPRLVWVRDTVRRNTVTYWPGSWSVPSRTFVRSIVERPLSNGTLVTAGVVVANGLTGPSSLLGRSGVFVPTATLSMLLASGSGFVLGNNVVLAENLVIAENIIVAEGVLLPDNVVLAENVIVAEGVIISESIVIAETGQPDPTTPNDNPLFGEP